MNTSSAIAPQVDQTIDTISPQSATKIWGGHAFAAAALDALKGLPKAVGVKLKKTDIYQRLTETVNSPEIQSTTTKEQKQGINKIIKEIKQVSKSTEPGTLGTNIKVLIKIKFRLKEGIEQERSQALGIIDGALRSDIKPETKTALLKLLNDVLSNNEVSDETKQQITDYINHMISDKENGWPEDVFLQNVGIFYKDGSSFAKDIDSKFNHETFEFSGDNKTLSLLQAIINSSDQVPEWTFNLLVGAANHQEHNFAEKLETSNDKTSDWLSKVMRGIKPEAFQKIADHILTKPQKADEAQAKKANEAQDKQVETITTLALAALPEDDNKINENCMPFTALSGLLSIDKNGLKGTDIVAHIGQALIDADCNYTVGEEARWTNSRTTAFLKALNAIDSTEIQEGQEKSPSNLAKEALCTCRQELTGNAYKFDVAIQHVADKECENQPNKDPEASESGNTTTPKPIIAFLADCFVNANDPKYSAIAQSMQNFKTDTESTLFQFKPSTCTAIKDAMKSLRDGEEPSDDQLQYFSEIQEKRYETLSDEKIVEKMQDILNAAADGTLKTELETNPNLFPSMYVLEHVCTLLNNPEKRTQMLNETNKTIKNDNKIQEALDIISEHYFSDLKQPKNTSQDQGTKNDTISNFKTFRSQNDGKSLEEIEVRKHEVLIEAKSLQNAESPAATLFTEQRELKGVSEYGNNCLFYAICGQKPKADNNRYNSHELRQKYVEIQKAGKEISEEEKQRLKTEQADISCLPQMATHLNRPIVVLTEKSANGQVEDSIRINLPGNNGNGYSIIISPDSLEKNFKNLITSGQNEEQFQDVLNAVATYLGLELENMKAQDALERLLSNDNTIALHFKGDTNGGHYQSFVPKKNEEEVQPAEEVKEEEKKEEVQEEIVEE